jgi:multiple sugar transport system substrate-binding protein
MKQLTRRAVLRASLGTLVAGGLARPFIANAAATTATVWWTQGFVPEEDTTIEKIFADYQKASGNTLEHSLIPFAPQRQKIISAITSGVVPDLTTVTPTEAAALQAWAGNLVDVSDVVETQKARMHEAVLANAYCYNGVEKRRAYYCVPNSIAVNPFHIWRPLIEKAGYKEADIPDKWDPFIDFFKPIQKKLQELGMRHTYATGFVVSTIGNDPNATFAQFLTAYGGLNIVTPDGKLHTDDPQVQEAVIKALEKLTSLYKEGYIPPSSINWNDADDNNAFHSKLCVMDFDGTLSTELAMIKDKQAYEHDMLTLPLPLGANGKPMPAQFGTGTLMVPKGAKNAAVAKDFAKYLIEPENLNAYLKGGLGRWLPPMTSIAQNDTWWTDPKRDAHVPIYVKEGLVDPTVPYYYSYNPAYAEVMADHNWNVAWADIVKNGMSPEQATEKALKQIQATFAKYPMQA